MKRKLTLLLTLSLLCTMPVQGITMPKWTTIVGGAACVLGTGAAFYLSPDALKLGLSLLSYLARKSANKNPDSPPASPPQKTDYDSDEPELYQTPDYQFKPRPEDFTAPEDPYVMHKPYPGPPQE